MVNDNEPAKLLLPYLQRADELQKHEPLVAYYCRLYAMERGLKIPQSERTKTTNALLVSLMKQLEKDKKSTQLGPEDNLYVEGFALNVFGKADKQDRAGRADLNTAKTFYAASIFFEILNQFGALQPDLEQKQKYAVWKAADIRKALKEGRTPIAGPPNGDEDLSVPLSAPSNRYITKLTNINNWLSTVFIHAGSRANETTVNSSGPESDPSTNYHNPINYQNLPNTHPAPKFHDTVNDHHSSNIPPSVQFHEGVNNNKHSSIVSPSSHPYASAGYPSQDYHPPPSSQDYHPPPSSQDYHPPPPSQDYHSPPSSQDYHPPPTSQDYHPPPPSQEYHPPPPSQDYHPPPPSQDYHSPPSSQDYHPPPPMRSETSYPEPYTHQQYSPKSSQHLGPNYPSHETSSYPHFQSSYPSFTESSLPSVPTNYMYHQSSDPSFSSQSAPLTTNHPSSVQHSSSSRNGIVLEPTPTAPTYQYDSNYQPTPEK
ncbi:putative vacuolar protein sorting-associate protein Vta1/Callose synthase [Lupinus albus]|uniref:Putative vacuolar protein sorting-associate protein Vta1/Callose synthase n=1 Tax=Lupinus albus TaxID=3870 RepID=A0A6A4MI76_LUPAL|nr:putative vacuolar protein sorting-associate protein Vta1/Callose synthase [Lupinus albus]